MDQWDAEVFSVSNGAAIQIDPDVDPFYLLSGSGEIQPQGDWYEDFFLSIEEYRGQNDVQDDHLYAALLRKTLQPGESWTIVASTSAAPNLDGQAAYAERQAYEQALLDRAGVTAVSTPIHHLYLAADQFIVCLLYTSPSPRD